MIMKNKAVLMMLAVLTVVVGCHNGEQTQVKNIPVIDKALTDTSSHFYAEFNDYPKDMHLLPIGVFDSGTGGLTVLEKLLSLDRFDNITGDEKQDNILDFSGEHFIYLADQANMPYGVYDALGKADYLQELVVKDALFLMSDDYYMNPFEDRPTGSKPQVKIIVIACNTATAYGLKHVQSMLDQSGTGVKVIGVINAGVKATLDQLDIKQGDAPVAIGVLATQGTISSGAYERTINDMVAERGITTKVHVVNQSGYGFAESVDSEPDYVDPSLILPRESYRGPRVGNGDDSLDVAMMDVYNFDFTYNRMLFNRDASGNYVDLQLNDAINYARFNLVSLVERHRKSGVKAPLKAVILGCTHYPFLIETLKQTIDELREYKQNGSYLYRELIADDFIFIDPAVYTAIECYETLRADNNLALRISDMEVAGYISVPSYGLAQECLTPDGKLTYDFKYGRQTNTEDITTKQVPFSTENIDENNLQRIARLLPYSYSLIAPSLY